MTARIRLLSLCLVFFSFRPAAGDPQQVDVDPETDGLRPRRLALVVTTGLGLRHAGYRYLDRAWYQGTRQDHIRWVRDWRGETYLNLDKGGHFMGGLLMARTVGQACIWSGFEHRTAAAIGTLISWVALLDIEMKDAYFDQWGFSIPDFAANTIGACVPLMHAFFPTTRAVSFKVSYFPSILYRDRRARRELPERPHVDHLIDDYEGMTFWLTVRPEVFLRGRARLLWPDYLGLAVGFGASGMHGSNVKSSGPNRYYPGLPDGRRELFVGLDWDIRYLPGSGWLCDQLKEQLNWVHFPTPAVRIYPDWRFYLLFM